MDRADFFASVRASLFSGSITQQQVIGCEAVIDECIRQSVPLRQAAYILATAYGETGGGMQPKRENMNYSARRIPQVFGAHRRQGVPVSKLAGNPKLLANTVYGGEWGRKNLGNTEPNDGWDFRGWGIGQWTGRHNTSKAARQVSMDLLSNPALLDDIHINAELLVRWMTQGGATGAKLSDYINDAGTDYHGARKVWGGVDAAKYVQHAKAFERALVDAEYSAGAVTPPPPDVDPEPIAHPDPAEKPQGLLAAIVAAFLSFFGGNRHDRN